MTSEWIRQWLPSLRFWFNKRPALRTAVSGFFCHGLSRRRQTGNLLLAAIHPINECAHCLSLPMENIKRLVDWCFINLVTHSTRSSFFLYFTKLNVISDIILCAIRQIRRGRGFPVLMHLSLDRWLIMQTYLTLVQIVELLLMKRRRQFVLGTRRSRLGFMLKNALLPC